MRQKSIVTVTVIIISVFLNINAQVLSNVQALQALGVNENQTDRMLGAGTQFNSSSAVAVNISKILDPLEPELGSIHHKSTDLYVDESNYYLGNGDVLKAIIWGVPETVLDISVNGETCIIPSVGAVDIGSVLLKDAKEKMIALIKKKYKTQRVDIFLSKVKDIRIQVQGLVINPGTYNITGNMNISALIDLIGGTDSTANLREIKLVHPEYGVRVVDIVKSNRIIGYREEAIRNGDRLFVPLKDMQVTINGAVHYSGNYDFVEGDKLSDIIGISGGVLASVDSSRIIVTRFVGEKDSTKKITVNIKDADTFMLEKDDMIMVSHKSQYRPIRNVLISGEVLFPGIYSIQENKTRLSDVISFAGGLTDDAFLGASKIIRHNFIDAGENEHKKLSSVGTNIVISPSESNYLKYRAKENTEVSINFTVLKMSENDINNILLREDDSIIIEKKSWTINVMGSVVRPGLIRYSEDKKINYYIEQAGGYKSDAIKKKVRVIKAGTEAWLHPSQVEKIEQGDAIWVPQKDYVAKIETQQGVSIAGGILGIIGSVATVITAAVTVISFVGNR